MLDFFETLFKTAFFPDSVNGYIDTADRVISGLLLLVFLFIAAMVVHLIYSYITFKKRQKIKSEETFTVNHCRVVEEFYSGGNGTVMTETFHRVFLDKAETRWLETGPELFNFLEDGRTYTGAVDGNGFLYNARLVK